ncbi:hypothetical protein [Tropicibacter oceani]|uniref:Uncharacterized protein n=1 Tax=Tropicibacter oceani TaxID=3058420 RepID=A0ABY8QGW4_9RHOB|nr:hypothetical protein [Tropicibacter oceani]WGW03881.1 hypothetical protein QF118_18495 [Tropicibacter oceani]
MFRLVIGAVSAIIFGLFSLGATDYMRQAVYAGVSPGEFGLSGWTQSFVERGKAAARRARLEARRDGPLRDYFPDAPAGWERVEWTRAHEEYLDGPKRAVSQTEQDMMSEIEAIPSYQAMKALDTAVGAGRDLARSKRAWVYTRGGDMVILSARFVDPKPAGRSGMFASISQNVASVDGGSYRVVKAYSGVAFSERQSWSNSEKKARRLRAKIGEELEITVRSNASLAAVGRVLKGIRYDDLRALVDAPTGDAPAQRQQELTAELKRQEQAAKRRHQEELQRIELKLDRMKGGARARGEQEVCLTQDDKRYCAWVD